MATASPTEPLSGSAVSTGWRRTKNSTNTLAAAAANRMRTRLRDGACGWTGAIAASAPCGSSIGTAVDLAGVPATAESPEFAGGVAEGTVSAGMVACATGSCCTRSTGAMKR
jgi:hypothetical protein